jgi:hypothetical protein
MESLDSDVDVAILRSSNVAELFKRLEEMDKDATQESVFLRGVKHLQSLQVPLERFKLALDLASPLASIEPTTGTVDDFLRHAELLRKLVEKATWAVVEDIKATLYDNESMSVNFESHSRPRQANPCSVGRWLDSGKMSRQSQHRGYLHDIRADEACQFLLADAQFAKWHRATTSQQLAIIGPMGTGKSVAMAFLIDELRRQSEHQLPQPKVGYHYCQSDATGQPVHILSSLILSLLEQLSGLKKSFFEWYKQTTASGIEPSTDFKTLDEWLQTTLETLDRPIVIAIDGMDECNRQSPNGLLQALRRMSERAPRLKILLSSRPEEEILEQLQGVGKVAIGTLDAARDRHIVEKTVGTRLCYLPSNVKALVAETLSQSAHGSALWTKMMVELIETRGIKALRPMRAFLRNIPQLRHLSELYVNLFSRYTSDDPENQRLDTAALEILAVTRRPLNILELGWAVAFGTAQEPVLTVDDLAQRVDHQRVLSLIHPFVSHVDFSNRRSAKSSSYTSRYVSSSSQTTGPQPDPACRTRDRTAPSRPGLCLTARCTIPSASPRCTGAKPCSGECCRTRTWRTGLRSFLAR